MFKKEYVLLDIDVKTKEEMMKFIATKASELGVSNNKKQTEEDLWNRENEFNTAIDDMVAIPHTKSESINFPVVFIIKSRNFIDWGGENIKLLVTFLTPKKNKDNIHLTMHPQDRR